MITLPLTLPDLPLSLDEMEATLHAWGLDAMRQGVAAAWQAQAAVRASVACPACQSSVQRRAGIKQRHLETRFGPVVVRRQRLRCQECGRYFQPDDALLTPARGADAAR
jgi:transposase-like protein